MQREHAPPLPHTWSWEPGPVSFLLKEKKEACWNNTPSIHTAPPPPPPVLWALRPLAGWGCSAQRKRLDWRPWTT